MKKVLIIFAHPEQQSLNGLLLETITSQLKAQGDEFQVSDLYAMKWKSQIDIEDFPTHSSDEKFNPINASTNYGCKNELSKDVLQEQKKLLWCDTLLLVFPLWWFNVPAILKGWVDRVFSHGFAYGYQAHYDINDVETLQKKTLTGRNVSYITTVGSPLAAYSESNPGDTLNSLLLSLSQTLSYTGMNFLQPLYVCGANGLDSKQLGESLDSLHDYLKNLPENESLKYISMI